MMRRATRVQKFLPNYTLFKMRIWSYLLGQKYSLEYIHCNLYFSSFIINLVWTLDSGLWHKAQRIRKFYLIWRLSFMTAHFMAIIYMTNLNNWINKRWTLSQTLMCTLFQVLRSDLDDPVNRLLTKGYKIAPVPKSNIYIIIKRKDRLIPGTCCSV